MKFNRFYIIAVLIFSAFIGCSLQTEKNIEVDIPINSDISGFTSLACTALLSTSVSRNQDSKKVVGELSKGTDKIVLRRQKADLLNVSTQATWSQGGSGDEFSITHEDNKKLIATWTSEITIISLVLDKTNGLAMWLKGTPKFPLMDSPVGEIIYMTCK